MIPTRYKAKLSHLMSYSTSAGTLSKVLEDILQANTLSIAFSASCQNPCKLTNPCKVLSISYFYRRGNLTSENRRIEQSQYGAKWKITVYPVLRTCVSAVRNQLDNEGLNKIQQWLSLYTSATGKDGNCCLQLLYNIDANQLSYKEYNKLLD